MIRLVFIIYVSLISLIANEQEFTNSSLSISKEISDGEYQKELEIVNKYSELIRETFKLEEQAYNKKSTRFEILDILLEVQKMSSSYVISQYIIDKTFMYVDMKDFKTFYKYTDTSYKLLYSRKLCSGYLLKANKIEYVQGDRIKALFLYKNGYKSCKIEHKSLALRSRYNILKYKMRR